MHILIPYTLTEKCNRDNIPHRLASISKHSDTVSMRGGQLIDEKVKICSFKECYSLLNFQFIAEKNIHLICYFPSKLIHYV